MPLASVDHGNIWMFKSLDEFASLFDRHGGTDHGYLARHYQRFCVTQAEFLSTWDMARGKRVLDIGAHWLHQALLWRQAGFELTAVDLPVTLELANVRALADAHDIRLVPCADLESARALEAIADSSIDVLLFTEIIEHLTFNPVAMWKQIHRILARGGRIVITTPNYYAWNGRMWNPGRFLSGFGGGISVDEILSTHTYGHHWREFSRRELVRYFCLLSPDFNTIKWITVRDYYPPRADGRYRLRQRVYEMIPGLRPNLHIEMELPRKDAGIRIEPGW